MKTIEERARSMADWILRRASILKNYGLTKMFADMLTEQKAIDDAELAEVKRQRDAYYDELLKLRQQKVIGIEKACDWLKENIYDYIAVGNTDFGKPYDIDLVADELFEDFRKAMEG